MSGAGSQFLADTLVYTGLLIVLALALRAPVARWSGPQVAYALWAMPLLRLFLPPLHLPASMAPAAPVAVQAEPVVLAAADAAPMAEVASASTFSLLALLPAPLSIAWLAGAALFLGWRVAQYRAMRRRYLADARPVGEVGKVRLLETPATAQPLAFGIFDKVVALPSGFMALHDRTARDLAIAHELAHHRGHDLAANMAAQLLLALHWFNPLAWIGWRAMRKDQEAACDARVVAGRESAERSRYAEVIAGFAAGDRLRLAAPLACQMTGEKSIIHRLRTLTKSEVPTMRRRFGLGVIGAGVLALPLTASITYAQPDASEAPRMERHIVIIDEPRGAAIDDPSLHSMEVHRADGTTVILRTRNPVSAEEARERVETAIASMPDAPMPPMPPVPPSGVVPPAPPAPVVRQFVLRRDGGEGDAPAADAETRVHRFAMIDRSGQGREVEITTTCDGPNRAQCRTEMHAQAMAERAAAQAEREAQMAERQAAQAERQAEHAERQANMAALRALQHARRAIESAPMPDEARAEALRELDREIAEMREEQEVSFVTPVPAKVTDTARLWRVAMGLRGSIAVAKARMRPGPLV